MTEERARSKDAIATTSGTAATPPFDPLGFDHILLLIEDMVEAIRFYSVVVGAKLESRMPEYGMASLQIGSATLDLVETTSNAGAWARPSVAGGRNVDHVCIAVSATSETSLRGHLAAHSVQIEEENVEEDSLSFYVRDPSGNQIEIKSLTP